MIKRPINGDSLEDGQLCLTFDDGPGESASGGPGPRTIELAEYLAGEGVHATFFLCGKYIRELPHAPARLRELGHAVGNHTYTHPDLRELAASGGDVVGEVVTTAELLGTPVGQTVWLRPPYGIWSDQAAGLLDAEPALSAHVGPVTWNIDGEDWRFWQSSSEPEPCAQAYIAKVELERRGIILMHDCTADNDRTRAANRTYDTIKLLVPALRERGFSFVTLDDVRA